MKKRLSLVVLIVLMELLLTACGKTGTEPAQKPKFPTKPVDLIVPFSAGGATDLGARILKPFLEKELSVTVNIVNKPGADGWIGWTELANAKPDGYTLGYLAAPTLVVHSLDPKRTRKETFASYTLLANHVTDAGVIVIPKDETRYTDMKTLIEFAKKNDMTAASTGVGCDDHLAILKVNSLFGTKFRAIQFKGAPEAQAAVLGKHVDVLFANVSEFASTYKTGPFKVLTIMSEKRSPQMADIPTTKESGFPGLINGSSRGIGAPKGLDPTVQEILGKALEKAINNPEHLKKQAEIGMVVDYRSGQGYTDLLKAWEQDVLKHKDALGWK